MDLGPFNRRSFQGSGRTRAMTDLKARSRSGWSPNAKTNPPALGPVADLQVGQSPPREVNPSYLGLSEPNICTWIIGKSREVALNSF